MVIENNLIFCLILLKRYTWLLFTHSGFPLSSTPALITLKDASDFCRSAPINSVDDKTMKTLRDNFLYLFII